MYDKRGSVWRKWDLHVHTPASIVQHYGDKEEDEIWEKYISDLESLPEEYSVLGINDYLFIDGYERLVKEKEENDRLENIDLLLPVIEFRIEKFAGVDFGPLKRMNLHIIFSNDLPIETIQSQFLNTLEQSYTLSNGNDWDRAITRESIRDLGKSIKKNVPDEELKHYGSDLIEGFNNLNVDEDQVFENLKKRDCFKNKYLTAIGKTEWDSLRWTDASIATKKTIINRSDIVFTAAENVEAFQSAFKKLTEQQVNNLLLDCSDAHHFSDSDVKDRIGNCFSWIKADPTFEGLKQVVFEPENRLQIGSNKPNEPLIKINNVNINLPSDAKLDKQDYCLKGHYDIQFSPFFTCLIGGRGTGKSSILNLIDHLVSEEKNKFFEKHELTDGEGNPVEVEKAVSLDNKSEKGDLEFLSQNEIEDFAQDQQRFTQAIYRRLKKLDSENEIENSVKRIREEINNIDEQINGFKELKTRRSEIKSLKKDIKKNENILASLQDEEYQENSEKLSEKTQRLQRINKSRGKFEEVLNSINQIKETIPEDLDDTIAFERALQEISESLDGLSNTYDLDQLSDEVAKETQELKGDIETITEEINQFLEEKGLSKENLKEASSAKTNLDLLRAEVEVNEEAYQKLKDKLESSSIDNSAKDSFEEVIQRHITKVNEKFDSLDNDDEHVKEIGLEYEFDFDGAREELGGKVQNWIEESETEVDSLLRIDHLESRLFLTEPANVDDLESFLEELQSDDTVIAKDLIKHFSNEFNFEIYKLMIAREFLNAEAYKQINVSYDCRPIQNTSFGQRCTAAIIILLSLGNNPIIIDEPEAHLDSALIADNLVDLIKSTKSQRQIIFATHNANFVVNGDAELVHVLSIEEDDGNKMRITPTTIEDLDKRPHLYALEGGEEAFKQRELRYNIS